MEMKSKNSVEYYFIYVRVSNIESNNTDYNRAVGTPLCATETKLLKQFIKDFGILFVC